MYYLLLVQRVQSSIYAIIYPIGWHVGTVELLPHSKKVPCSSPRLSRAFLCGLDRCMYLVVYIKTNRHNFFFSHDFTPSESLIIKILSTNYCDAYHVHTFHFKHVTSQLMHPEITHNYP